MIEVKNLTKSYIFDGKKNYVFKNLNFKINTGESVALLGRNGGGKVTLLRILGELINLTKVLLNQIELSVGQ